MWLVGIPMLNRQLFQLGLGEVDAPFRGRFESARSGRLPNDSDRYRCGKRTARPGRKFIGDVQWRIISPHYFDVLRIPLFPAACSAKAKPVPLSSSPKPWRNASGRAQIRSAKVYSLAPSWAPSQVGLSEIIGVVGDVRERLDIGPPGDLSDAFANSRCRCGARG
jgi:hypothetical protein